MAARDRPAVVLLPGAVLPAAVAYADLIAELEPDVRALAKELELYADDGPPETYKLGDEVEGVIRAAAGVGPDAFHLVGYSAGGAVGLAVAARYPERVRSLVLMEPAWAGNEDLGREEANAFAKFANIVRLPPPELMDAFIRAQLRPGVEPPRAPPGPAPPWMSKRPDGLVALTRAFDEYELDMDALRGYRGPVHYVLGGRSNPDLFQSRAERLAELFENFTLEVYEDRHHFDPPHRAEPRRLARSLRRVWGAVPGTSSLSHR